MNNLYQWHDERMVDYEMQEIRRELAQASLFKEAGISEMNWLARVVDSLRKLLKARSKKLHDTPFAEHQS